MHNHRQLSIWKASINFTDAIYSLTENFPKSEELCLTNQILRAAISVPSNIAEGAGRGSNKDFAKFLDIAQGSLAEVDTQLTIAEHRNYITKEYAEDIQERISRLRAMIYKFKDSLLSSSSN